MEIKHASEKVDSDPQEYKYEYNGRYYPTQAEKEYQEYLDTRQGKWATWIGVPAGFAVVGAIGWGIVWFINVLFATLF